MKHWKWIVGSVITVIVIGLAVYYGKQVHFSHLSRYLVSLGVSGMIIGAVLIYLQTFFPFIPFIVLAGVNVAIFGLKWGFVINYSMSCLGAVSAFVVARHFGHAWVDRKIAKYPMIQNFNRLLEKDGLFYTLMGRLVPIIPSSAVSFGAGVTAMRMSSFVIGTVIGKIPIIILESMIAHDVLNFKQNKFRLLVLMIIFSLIVAIGYVVKKKWMDPKVPPKVPPKDH
ncbi:TVP38/TMEM64 family protein [Paenibacillus sp. N1-5-1-14]|uniref:TVP38/TMEM64 family protein n=1 Tax=Paenibacillus radicibacter TaxID=2972488 RepID=UPI002158F6F4|nr:TVP38/TMEM64 family protein [Paenibacillus radicibacter]MCR8641756.1 TVP38/TMEM64 family protein [Paenibacillus radicibacter]